jgi:hypothetical protein
VNKKVFNESKTFTIFYDLKSLKFPYLLKINKIKAIKSALSIQSPDSLK